MDLVAFMSLFDLKQHYKTMFTIEFLSASPLERTAPSSPERKKPSPSIFQDWIEKLRQPKASKVRQMSMDDRWEDMIRQGLIRHHLIQPLMNIQLEMLKKQKIFSWEVTGGRLC